MWTAPSRRGVLVAATAALAGCSVLPEQENEPIAATAATPAELPDSDEYTVVASEETTFETTLDVDLSGDVQISAEQDVTATIFRRVYEFDDGLRFGVLTAPAVAVIEQPEVIRDPLTGLDATRLVEMATEYAVESVEEWQTDGSTTLLGTETTRRRTTGVANGRDRTFVMARVEAGEDSVTAVASAPDGWTPPFGDVSRDA